jgi:hypothetical protein
VVLVSTPLALIEGHHGPPARGLGVIGVTPGGIAGMAPLHSLSDSDNCNREGAKVGYCGGLKGFYTTIRHYSPSLQPRYRLYTLRYRHPPLSGSPAYRNLRNGSRDTISTADTYNRPGRIWRALIPPEFGGTMRSTPGYVRCSWPLPIMGVPAVQRRGNSALVRCARIWGDHALYSEPYARGHGQSVDIAQIRGVAQLGMSAWFGTTRSAVRIRPPRPGFRRCPRQGDSTCPTTSSRATPPR